MPRPPKLKDPAKIKKKQFEPKVKRPEHDDYNIFESLLRSLAEQRTYTRTEQFPEHWKHKLKVEAKARGERPDYTGKLGSKNSFIKDTSTCRTIIDKINAERESNGLPHVRNYRELRIAFEGYVVTHSEVLPTTMKGYYYGLAKAMRLTRETWPVELPTIHYNEFVKNRGPLSEKNKAAIAEYKEAWDLAIAIGARKKELHDIRFSDVDIEHWRVSVDDGKGGKKYNCEILPEYKEMFKAVYEQRRAGRHPDAKLFSSEERRAGYIPWHRARAIHCAFVYFAICRSDDALRDANKEWWHARHEMTPEERKRANKVHQPIYSAKRGDGTTIAFDRDALLRASVLTGHNRDEVIAENYAQYILEFLDTDCEIC